MTRRSLMRQQAGGSGRLQVLILIVFLALGGIAGVKLLARAVDTRSQCAGEQIRTLEPGAGPCGEGAQADPASTQEEGPEQARGSAGGCGGGDESSGPRPGDPSLDQALADPHVQAELERAWNESNPDAAEVPSGQDGSQKHEQGGWIVWNRETGEFEVIRWDRGSRDGMTPPDRPSDNDQQVVVGWFHTHPNTEAEGYQPDPSPADINWTNDVARVPGVVETHDGRKIIPYGGGSGGGSFVGRPGGNGNLLPLAALLLLAALRRLRRAFSAAMVKIVPLRDEVIMIRRRSLCLGLLLCAVAPAVLGCRQEKQERPSEMANTGALPADEQRLIDKAAEDHVLQKKGWQRSEFRLEPHGLSKDGAAVVWAVHSADERSPTLGSGKSVALHVDRQTRKVIKELRFQ